MKNDLIDRNELYNQIRLYLNRHSLGETTVQTTLTIGEIASIIADIPAAKAPVRHEKWVEGAVTTVRQPSVPPPAPTPPPQPKK